MKKITVYWCSKTTKEQIYDIRRWFNIPTYTTVNGETPCEVDDDYMEQPAFFSSEDIISLCVSMIDWLIENNHFNKEYLK